MVGMLLKATAPPLPWTHYSSSRSFPLPSHRVSFHTTCAGLSFICVYCELCITVRNGIRDPVNRLWDLYKRHNRGGLLRIRAFNIELVGIILNTSRAFSSLKVYIGDFKMLKEVFNNPDAQARAIPQIHEVRYCVLCM